VKKRSYRQLTPEERHTIQIMRQAGSNQAEVARAIGRAASTVSRELRRNRAGGEDYQHALAQTRARECRACRRGHRARTQEAWPTICWLLGEGFTAGQIGLLATELAERTVYRLIATDRASGGRMYRHLPRGCRPRRRVCRYRRGPIPNRRDISERPADANARSEFGHWEADLVEGLDARSFLLVLRERKSRLCRIVLLFDKRAETVANALIRELTPFLATFRSLTVDNGGEFAEHERVAAALKRSGCVFFARPYRAGDKGSLEQLNGLIRRRYPKRTDFRKVPQADLDALRDHLNLAPLKVTGGRSPGSFFNDLRPA